MPLPFCPDEVLLDELGVAVTAGWQLPTRPLRLAQVGHLLLLADREAAGSSAARAERFLRALDAAFIGAVDVEGPAALTGEQSAGLRILFGTHPDYRNRSVTVRRENASEYLVPQWVSRPPAKRAQAFEKRHEQSAIRLALNCLKGTYGQDTEVDAELETSELIEESRFYVVDSDRQVRRMRVHARIRSLLDELEYVGSYEGKADLPGFRERTITPLRTDDGIVTLIWDRPYHYRPGRPELTFRLPRVLSLLDEISYSWEEETSYNDNETEDWTQYFVSMFAHNDNYTFRMSVRFEGELPLYVWPFAFPPRIDLPGRPRLDNLLTADPNGTYTYEWAPTERRIEYGMAWQWANHVDEDHEAEDEAYYEHIMADEFQRMDASSEANDQSP